MQRRRASGHGPPNSPLQNSLHSCVDARTGFLQVSHQHTVLPGAACSTTAPSGKCDHSILRS
eukprot:363221-Chlamydomonas_euryale.AAC.27